MPRFPNSEHYYEKRYKSLNFLLRSATRYLIPDTLDLMTIVILACIQGRDRI